MMNLRQILHQVVAVLLAVAALTAVAAAKAESPQPGVIRVIVEGIETPLGTIRYTLDASSETFGQDEKQPFRTGSVAATSSRVSFELRDVPPGNYAVRLFHDVNDNGKVDFNILGIPSEAYGISNNARGMFGLPSFEDAAFNHTSSQTLQTIHVSQHFHSRPRMSQKAAVSSEVGRRTH